MSDGAGITSVRPEVPADGGRQSVEGTILRVENLVKYFPIRKGILKRTVGQVHAVDGVDLEVSRARRSSSSASRAAGSRLWRARF